MLSRVCLAVVLAAFLTRALLAWRGLDTFYLTPCRMDALAIGAWLALRVRQDQAPAQLLKSARAAALRVGLVLLPIYLAVTGSHSPALQATKSLAIGLWYGALLLWLTLTPGAGLLARCATHPLLRFFGNYSYGLYVFHVFALYALAGRLDLLGLAGWTRSIPAGTCLWLLLATAASLLPAWLSWHLYEKHFLRLKRHFAPGGYAAQPAAGQSAA